MAGRGQRGTGPLAFVLIVHPPLRPVIEALLFDGEATVLAECFLEVRGDVSVTLGALVAVRLSRYLRQSFFIYPWLPSFLQCSGNHQYSEHLTH